MKNCLLCSFNEKEQCIDEASYWYIDEPDYVFPGLFFIRLKRHCESLAELTDEESGELGGLIKTYSAKSYEASGAQRVLAMSLGLADPHIHFWIVPKTEENKDDIDKIRLSVKGVVDSYRYRK